MAKENNKDVNYEMSDSIKLYKEIRPNVTTSNKNILYWNSTEAEE